jgi:hypothetical protein
MAVRYTATNHHASKLNPIWQDYFSYLVQNGHIIDGLLLFKKNVSLYFEGQVECAICYS